MCYYGKSDTRRTAAGGRPGSNIYGRKSTHGSKQMDETSIYLAQILTSYRPPSWSATATETATATATWLRARRTNRALPHKSRDAREGGARPRPGLSPSTRRSASASAFRTAEGSARGELRASSSQPMGSVRGISRRGAGAGKRTLD